MPKHSAGIMLYRKVNSSAEVFLVHPGGPFWAKKDLAAWSVPKGEYLEDEEPLAAAKREFNEETSMHVPTDDLRELGDVKYGNKILRVWMGEGNIDARRVKSSTIKIEWPPKTGRIQEFPEVDRAGWFTLDVARTKLVKGQIPLIDMAEQALGLGPSDGAMDQLSFL